MTPIEETSKIDPRGEPWSRRVSRRVIRGFDRVAFRDARLGLGLVPAELARLAAVSDNAVRNWENNVSVPQIDKLRRCAAVLGVSIADLVKIPPTDRTLSDLRVLAGMTQPEVAARAGMATSTLAAIERAHRPLREPAKLADALGVTCAEVEAAYALTVSQPPSRA